MPEGVSPQAAVLASPGWWGTPHPHHPAVLHTPRTVSGCSCSAQGAWRGQEPQGGGDGTGWCHGITAQLCSHTVKGCRGAQGSRAACVLIVRGKGHSWVQRESRAKTTSRIKHTDLYAYRGLRVTCTQRRKSQNGTGEGKGWRRRGEQGEEGGNPALASTTAVENVGHCKQSIEKKAGLGVSSSNRKSGRSLGSTACLISQTPDAISRAIREHHSAHKETSSREQDITSTGSVGQEPPRETITTWQESHAPSSSTPPTAA